MIDCYCLSCLKGIRKMAVSDSCFMSMMFYAAVVEVNFLIIAIFLNWIKSP